MKIYILYKLKSGPFGGVNQFLTALAAEFKKKEILTDKIEQSDVILFNSHLIGAGQGKIFSKLMKLKFRYPEKIFIHRLDGPLDKYRGENSGIDKELYYYNNLIADGTIFQSNWSREENYKIGFKKNSYEATIINAPDPDIFNRSGKKKFIEGEKIRLISASWSKNINKGFKIYEYLDKNLNQEKYEMTYIGNSPLEFENIKRLEPLNSRDLTAQLKAHDIFITASRHDPCSNALIEAMHCGLPVVALNSGGHPEIVKDAGEFFHNEADITKKIDQVADNYKTYQAKLDLPDINFISKEYENFARKIYADYKEKTYLPKKISRTIFYQFLFRDNFLRIKKHLWT